MNLKDVRETNPMRERILKAPKAAEVKEPINVQHEVGLTAGRVWQALSADGPQTLTELKKKFNGSADYVNFALGWLAREEKVEIVPDRRTFKVKLR